MKGAIYNLSTGKIRQFFICPPDAVDLQCFEDEEFYLDCPLDATYIINNEPVTIVPEEPIILEPTLEEVKEAKLSSLASIRYEKEIGGIAVSGATIATDRASQALITGAYVSLKQGFISSVNWKGENSWVTLTLVEIEPIAQAVCNYVQACFTKECILAQQISNLSSIADIENFDINSGWPTREF